jgi:hypothetical protein
VICQLGWLLAPFTHANFHHPQGMHIGNARIKTGTLALLQFFNVAQRRLVTFATSELTVEIFEFIVGCIEALAEWRMVLMIGLGVALAVLSLIWVRPDPLSFVLAGVGFVGCVIYGIYWQRSAERRRP